MSETTQFELVSPEKLLISEPVDMVVVPGAEGHFGVLARHQPMISTLVPGVIEVHRDGQISERLFVAGGFAEVTEERCTVLAEEAVAVSDIDASEVDRRIAALEEEITDADSDEERVAFRARLAVAVAMREAAAGRG